jgi:glycosyltransferase involved in cell wall biosynthesis
VASIQKRSLFDMMTASVVITTKNRREELLKAVESAMGQRGLLEVIVIDDGSTDGTEAAVMEMLKKNLTTESTENTEEQAGLRLTGQAGAAFSNPSPSEHAWDSENTLRNRSAIGPAPLPATSYSTPVTTGGPVLRLIRHEVSAGYIVRRNEGARLAKGDVIFSMDDDAVFSSPFVVEQTLRDFSHPRIGAVAIPYIEPHKANTEIQRAPTREDVWITASYIGTAHAVRRDVFLALGGYREHLVHQGEEGDFCLRMLAAEQPITDCGGPRTEGTTDDSDNHGWGGAWERLDKPSDASESDSLASELTDSHVSESLTRSASGPALARIAPGGVGSGGGDQLSDSGGGVEGQSQAGLQMDSQKHLIRRAAMGSTSSGDNSSSVSIREIRGKKKSGAQEAQDASLPATGYRPPVTAPGAPGFFVRLGNSDPVIHNESPKRDFSRMDFYGRRNDVLFHWQNTPMPDLLWQLPMTIAGGLLCAYRVKRWREMLDGVGAGLVAIASGVKRQPVSKRVVSLHKVLKRSTQKFRIFIQ